MRAVLLLAGLLCLLLAFAGSGPARDLGPALRGNFGMEEALAFAEFPLYDAGDRVDGLQLVAVLRRNDTADFVSFVYGDCAARDDAGCAPPGEVQVWPACRRNLSLYDSPRPGTPVPERSVVRGVPAAFLDDGERLELQTGRSTVVVFGDSRARVLRMAAALRRLRERPSDGPLPDPEPGAVDGTLPC
jgi:hypothetical protein